VRGLVPVLESGIHHPPRAVYSALWVWLARRNLEPGAPMKFALGLIILGWLRRDDRRRGLVASGRQVLPTWLIFTYLLHTMGELALSPVGLSAMTKLAPQRFVGQMMGIWFMANSLGYVIASSIAARSTPAISAPGPGSIRRSFSRRRTGLVLSRLLAAAAQAHGRRALRADG